MDVVGDLVDRDRRRKEPLVYGAGSQPYTAHKFCTDAWKAASLFRYHGVGPGRSVAVADDPSAPALLALFGAALLGTTVEFGLADATDPRLAVGPAATVAELAVVPGTKRVAYGGEVDDPAVIEFERGIWSENPTMPPDRVAPDAALLVAEGETYDHGRLLAAAERTVAETGLDGPDAVAVRSSLTHPGTVVAGVLAPLLAEAAIVLPGADRDGTVAVAAGEAPESVGIDPAEAAP
ncbi:MAG: hypothetical protein ABEJ31_07165 [Haloarculaceae archaeon]